jgi:hypothetical protein
VVIAKNPTTVIVEMKAAIKPASQVDLGARKPAIIGGTNGTGKRRNWKTVVRTGSV